MKFVSLLFLILAATCASVLANEGRSATGAPEGVSDRMGNKLGVYLGLGEPAPAVIGVSLAYNLRDFLRLAAGVGKVSVSSGMAFAGTGLAPMESSATTFGLGAVAMMPGWSITPTAGLHFANLSYSGAGGLMVDGFAESGSHLYGSLGVDYQAQSGFRLGGGLNQSFRSGVGTSLYLSAGWFFDWLG